MKKLTALILTLLLALLPIVSLAEDEDVLSPFDSQMAFVKAALDTMPDIHYTVNSEKYYYTVIYATENKNLGDIYAYLDVYLAGILVQASYRYPIPEDRIDEVAVFMNLINGNLLQGKFYIYPDSGDIYYETFLHKSLLDLAADEQGAYAALIEAHLSVVAEAYDDMEYIDAIVNGETAANAYAMYEADQR